MDPDVQVGGGGGKAGPGHPDPEIRREPGLKFFFSALRASVWSKNKGGGPLPWICHCYFTENIMKDLTFSQSSLIVPVRAQYAKTYRDTTSK